MDQVFNMGIGMVLIVSAKRAEEALRLTKGIRIGEITAGFKDVVIS
jgi:phosphoribosylaminoimidazole (AIR) synthetase